MKKNRLYFPHDYNARSDPKMQDVMMTLGCEGIGIYWCMVEMLYEEDGIMPLKSLKSIAFSLHVDYEKVLKLVNDFGLFDHDEDVFWSESVKRRINQREDISEKRRSAIRSRWKKEKAGESQETSEPQEPQHKETNYTEFYYKFFSEKNYTVIKRLCDDYSTSIKELGRLTNQIIREWILTEQQHKDYNDAARHLITLIKKRLKESKGKGSECIRGADVAESREAAERRRKEMEEERKNAISYEKWQQLKKEKKELKEA